MLQIPIILNTKVKLVITYFNRNKNFNTIVTYGTTI